MSLPKNFYNAVDARKMGLDDIERIKAELDSMEGLPEVTAADAGKTVVVGADGSWELGEAGGEPITVNFTVLADNPDHSTSVTLSDSIDNYDFIYVVLYDSYNEIIRSKIVTTPTIIRRIMELSNGKVCFNDYNINIYITIQENITEGVITWDRTNDRYLRIHSIIGITVDKTVTNTVIYDRGSIASGQVQPSAKINVDDYDMIFFASCTGDSTETTPCYAILTVNPTVQQYLFPFNRYNSGDLMKIDATGKLPENWYFRIEGVKFS